MDRNLRSKYENNRRNLSALRAKIRDITDGIYITPWAKAVKPCEKTAKSFVPSAIEKRQ